MHQLHSDVDHCHSLTSLRVFTSFSISSFFPLRRNIGDLWPSLRGVLCLGLGASTSMLGVSILYMKQLLSCSPHSFNKISIDIPLATTTASHVPAERRNFPYCEHLHNQKVGLSCLSTCRCTVTNLLILW